MARAEGRVTNTSASTRRVDPTVNGSNLCSQPHASSLCKSRRLTKVSEWMDILGLFALWSVVYGSLLITF